MDLAMAHMAHPRFLLCSLGLKKMVCTWVSTPNNEKMPGICYTRKLNSYGQSPIDDLLFCLIMVIFYVAMLIYQRVTQPQTLKIIPVWKARQGRVKLDQCHRKVFSLRFLAATCGNQFWRSRSCQMIHYTCQCRRKGRRYTLEVNALLWLFPETFPSDEW